MSSTTSYNPFTAIGRYNLKNFFYENKKTVISMACLIIFVLIFAFYNVYSQQDHPKVLNIYRPIVPPQYGYGPYGYGLYAPPRELMEQT
jgi:hypothetical protein